MHSFARGVGFMNLVAGMLLLTFPNVVRQIIQARAEFSRLSDGALRLLGVWTLLTGGALIGATATERIESLIGEALAPGRRPIA